MSGNFYRPHPLMIDSGTFWRCKHGTTGLDADFNVIGCAECRQDFIRDYGDERREKRRRKEDRRELAGDESVRSEEAEPEILHTHGPGERTPEAEAQLKDIASRVLASAGAKPETDKCRCGLLPCAECTWEARCRECSWAGDYQDTDPTDDDRDIQCPECGCSTLIEAEWYPDRVPGAEPETEDRGWRTPAEVLWGAAADLDLFFSRGYDREDVSEGYVKAWHRAVYAMVEIRKMGDIMGRRRASPTVGEMEDALARLDAELDRVANREDRIELDAGLLIDIRARLRSAAGPSKEAKHVPGGDWYGYICNDCGQPWDHTHAWHGESMEVRLTQHAVEPPVERESGTEGYVVVSSRGEMSCVLSPVVESLEDAQQNIRIRKALHDDHISYTVHPVGPALRSLTGQGSE